VKHRLAQPLPAVVRADDRGRPLSVDGRSVDAIRESWLVEDRWWADAPVRRRYWEIVTVRGELLILFRELQRGGWYRQR
jgi:CO dehydrogenase/acetyl-CoA synthase delta subunit